MTTNHISDDLPRLLSGEASRDVVLEAAAHLRTCADCQQELVSAVIAHAALTSAQRFAPEVVRPAAPAAATRTTEPQPLPDLSAVFHQVRAEVAAESDPEAPRRRRRVVLGAAAAAVVVGGGIAIGVVSTSGSSGPPTRTLALQSVGAFHGRPTVTMVGTDRMKVNATSLPPLTAGRRYEVWLAGPGNKMQAVGFVGSDRTADLTLTSDLIAQYREVAISEQRRNQTQFSGVLVASGSYA